MDQFWPSRHTTLITSLESCDQCAFLIGFPEALQNLPSMSHKIKLNCVSLTMILPCLYLYLPWGMRNGNFYISAYNRSYSESPESPGMYYTSLERYFWRKYNAVEIVENGSVVMEKIWNQGWQLQTWGGGLPLFPCLGFKIAWSATYDYLRRCYGLWQKGNGPFYWRSLWKSQK